MKNFLKLIDGVYIVLNARFNNQMVIQKIDDFFDNFDDTFNAAFDNTFKVGLCRSGYNNPVISAIGRFSGSIHAVIDDPIILTASERWLAVLIEIATISV